MRKVLMVVDGPNLVWRSIHAIKPGGTFEGAITGPLVLFVRTLSRYVREERPDELVICWEGGRKSEFRSLLYPQYKATRKTADHPLKEESFRLVQKFLDLCHINQCSVTGFEADDVIAALWRENQDTHDILVLSSDKDLLQLVGPHCRQIRFSGGGAPTDVWTEDHVKEEFGCTPDKLSLLMAVMGDRGDNVPGIMGMGVKKSFKALEEHGWDLEANTHPAIKSNRETVLLSHRLIDLRDPESIPDVSTVSREFRPVRKESPSYDLLKDFLLAHQLNDLYNRMESNTLWEDGRRNVTVHLSGKSSSSAMGRAEVMRLIRGKKDSANTAKKEIDPDLPTPSSLLNGDRLSEEVEGLLRRRLLEAEEDATRKLYESAGMVKNELGNWVLPEEGEALESAPEAPPEPTNDPIPPIPASDKESSGIKKDNARQKLLARFAKKKVGDGT